jgi:hypothetical protein
MPMARDGNRRNTGERMGSAPWYGVCRGERDQALATAAVAIRVVRLDGGWVTGALFDKKRPDHGRQVV